MICLVNYPQEWAILPKHDANGIFNTVKGMTHGKFMV